MLLEIHILQNHAPSNLNRDDTGSPKECMFGGVRRARISSQCLKRSIRQSDIFQSELAGQLGSRTRRLPEIVRDQLLELGLSEEMAAVAALKASGFGTKDGKERPTLDTAQTIFLTHSDIQAVVDVLKAAADEAKTADKFNKMTAKELQSKAVASGFRPISVDVALFGRMTTSEAFRDVEASTQVAHAISTHKVDHEFDYFTAVDDLQGLSADEDAGADMIGDVEFNSSCYYKYFSIDVAGLCKNLTGENVFRKDIPQSEKDAAVDTARKAVTAFIKAAVMTTPTGKQNTFAAHQLPSVVFVEARPYKTPVSYANAFVQPAYAGKGDDLVWASLRKFSEHINAIHDGFNLVAEPRLLLAPSHPDFKISGVTPVTDLNTLCSLIGGVINYG